MAFDSTSANEAAPVDKMKLFANKIWNITRYVLTANEGWNGEKPKLISEVDLNNISELNNLVKDVTNDMDNFRFYLAAEKLYHYLLYSDLILFDDYIR